jgi:aspartate-semialdehyde dehydrogenase
MSLPSNPVVAVVGATGAVGRVMLDILHQRSFPASRLVPIASARSAGRRIAYGDGLLEVLALGDGVFEGVDLVLLDTPNDVAAAWAPEAVAAGALVIDNSAAWRMDPAVPLVVPEVNPEDARKHKGIIASPNCATIGVVVPLGPLHRTYGLKSMLVSTYQATSGAGQPGVVELSDQAAKMVGEIDALLGAGAAEIAPEPRVFAGPIAFNVIPLIGRLREGGWTGEEAKLLHESRKIMGIPDLEVFATCIRVPSVVGHGASVYARFALEVDPEHALELLENAPGVELSDLPNPISAAGTDPCYVGRVRGDQFNPKALSFFTVSDNLRKGAALNAIQIAELLLP